MNNEMKKACEKNASDQIAKLQAFPEDISIRRVSPVGHIEVWKMNYTIRKMEPDEYEILKDFYMKRSVSDQ